MESLTFIVPILNQRDNVGPLFEHSVLDVAVRSNRFGPLMVISAKLQEGVQAP